MIANTSAAVLVKHHDVDGDQVMAQWPERGATDPGILDAAAQVVKKQRLHLNPVDQGLFLGHPITVDGAFWGAIVLRINARNKVDVQATIKLLQWGMTWLQFLLYRRQSEVSADEGHSANMLDLLASALKEPSLEESGIALVNKLAVRFKSQRVSLGLYGKQGIELLAVSFAANFDRRTQTMQAIADAMLEAVEQRLDIHYAGNVTGGKPEAILRAHELLRQSNHSTSVSTLLLRLDNRIIGAVTIEANRSEPLAAEATRWLDQNLASLTHLFHLKKTATTGLGQSFKTAGLSLLQRWFGCSHLRGKLATIAVAVFLLLLIVPADYRISGNAILENTNKHVLVAPQDGYLDVINSRPGDEVRQGAVLAQLSDDILTLERRKLASQLQQYRQEYDNALATSNRSQAAITNAQVEQATAQLRLIEQQLERIKLTAPIDGVIVSDDIRQSQGAPVKQGDTLFEIASGNDYFVQLYVDERDITAIKPGQAGRLVLTGLPGDFFDFSISRITPVSEIRDGRNYFRVEAALLGDNSKMRPGMTGSGKITAGQRALGWIWFHDIWHWLRLFLWL